MNRFNLGSLGLVSLAVGIRLAKTLHDRRDKTLPLFGVSTENVSPTGLQVAVGNRVA